MGRSFKLNCCYEGKKDGFVFDSTNHAKAILSAYVKYLKGMPFEPEEPDKEQGVNLFKEILRAKVLAPDNAKNLLNSDVCGPKPVLFSAATHFKVRLRRRDHRLVIHQPSAERAVVDLLDRGVLIDGQRSGGSCGLAHDHVRGFNAQGAVGDVGRGHSH